MKKPWDHSVDVGDGVCKRCRSKVGDAAGTPRTLRDVLARVDARKCCRKTPAYVAALRRSYSGLVETHGLRAATFGAWADGADHSERVECALYEMGCGSIPRGHREAHRQRGG
jgi:hypothetical protein